MFELKSVYWFLTANELFFLQFIDIRPGSSGKPIGGYEVRLVDSDGNDVPVGEVGNLMVRGESTALFYLHQYEKSRQTFRGEWLATGDQYVMDEDGY